MPEKPEQRVPHGRGVIPERMLRAVDDARSLVFEEPPIALFSGWSKLMESHKSFRIIYHI